MQSNTHGRLSRGGIVALALLAFFSHSASAADTTAAIVSDAVVFEEQEGVLALEAEHFYKQTQSTVRAWHIHSTTGGPSVQPDGDESHVAGAAGGAYIEALPDTRRTHDDKLIRGTNFTEDAGLMGVLHYKTYFHHPGRYYVWARAYSTGSEDNGLHIGIDGSWPESGKRWQTVAKNGWNWDSKQRTETVHVGEPYRLYLDITTPGPHELLVGMREDGFELDRLVLTTRRENGRPQLLGPDVRVMRGNLPKTFPFQAVASPITQSQEPTTEASPALVEPRGADGNGSVTVSGELKQWHKVTLTLDGPFAHERDKQPNPFTDLAMSVTFTHESGSPSYVVPGYFAADGDAANSGAQAGTKWRAHLAPDKTGKWSYAVRLQAGKQVALTSDSKTQATDKLNVKGTFTIAANDKVAPDLRAKGRLEYVDQRYLRFAGNGEYFLKAGPDSPETMLAYADFDDTQAPQKKAPLKTWQPHVRDWQAGDPSWGDGKGKGLIGAINYLSAKGCNTLSFMPYNAGGDGDNVWPFTSRNDKLHYDCSKLDQWQIVFDHATQRGLHLHFKLQETEMDDNRVGNHGTGENAVQEISTSLDGGKLGPQRKLYCRELVARFGYELALLWNIGEENTQSPAEQRDMIRYLDEVDPYRHNIVIHTFPGWQERVYNELLGDKSLLTGASLQNSWNAAHERTAHWIEASAQAGRPWVVCNDEQGPASDGVPADQGYEGNDGFAEQGGKKYTRHDIRKLCLWGTLMAGGGGVEYYFGYKLPQNDLICQDFRSRDKSWEACKIALDFFQEQQIPFWEMNNADALIGNPQRDNSKFCLAKQDAVYLVYLPNGGSSSLDLSGASGAFQVQWFNPREGGPLASGSVRSLQGGGNVSLGNPPDDQSATEDWLVVIRR